MTSVGALRQVHDAVDAQAATFPRAEHLVLDHPLQLEVLAFAVSICFSWL
jgi:hypothetical protein